VRLHPTDEFCIWDTEGIEPAREQTPHLIRSATLTIRPTEYPSHVMGTFGTNRIYSVGRMVKVADRMRWGVCSRAGSIPSVSQMQNSSPTPPRPLYIHPMLMGSSKYMTFKNMYMWIGLKRHTTWGKFDYFSMEHITPLHNMAMSARYLSSANRSL